MPGYLLDRHFLVLVVLLAAAGGPEFSSSVSGNLCFVLVDLEKKFIKKFIRIMSKHSIVYE